MEKESLWRRVVVARFGEAYPWESKGVWIRHGYGLWKSIMMVKDIFWKFIQFKLGSKREIRFWEDRWIGNRPLRDVFRNLYSLATDSMGRVSDVFDEENNIWRPSLHWNLNDWKIGEFGQLLALLEDIKANPSMGDSWEWVL